jgi:hypothetical protein
MCCMTNAKHLTSEIVEFFNSNASQVRNPIRKLAILGVSDFQRFWYRCGRYISWPKMSCFFSDWGKAKDWLVAEGC